MSDATAPAPGSRADRIRRRFDASFAEPPAPPRPPAARWLLVRLGDTPCAVPLEDCSGVEPLVRMSPLPARQPGFRGLASVRGAVLPVYDAAERLGSAPQGEARWLLLSTGSQRVAFLAAAVDGYAETPRDASAGHPVLTITGTARRVVRLTDLVNAIARAAAAPSRSTR